MFLKRSDIIRATLGCGPDNLALIILGLNGAGEGIRTPDPLITNQMLYQLSYAGLCNNLRKTGCLTYQLTQACMDNLSVDFLKQRL